MCQEQGNSGVGYCFINVAIIHGALFLAFEYFILLMKDTQ